MPLQLGYLDPETRPVPPLFSDPAIGPPPASPLVAAPSSGIGLSETQAPAPVETRAPQLNPAAPPSLRDQTNSELQNLPTMGKIGLLLQSFSAGVAGRKNPIDEMMQQKRQERLLQTQETRANVQLFHEVIGKLQTIDDPVLKEQAVRAAAKQMEQLQPGMGELIKPFAADPGLLTKFMPIMKYMPPHMQTLFAVNPALGIKLLGTAEGQKEFNVAANQYYLSEADKKAGPSILASVSAHEGYPVPPAIAAKIAAQGGKMTQSQFNAIQEVLPEGTPGKMTPQELAAVNRSKTFFHKWGIISGEGEEKMATERPLVINQGGQSTVLRPADVTSGQTFQHINTPMEQSSITHQAIQNQVALGNLDVNRARLAQDRIGKPTEVSIGGKNILVMQDGKSGKLLDMKGNDVTATVAPKITGGQLDPGRISMALQASQDINDAEKLMFDKNGKLDNALVAAMGVPGTSGVGTNARIAYSAIENAVAAKLRGETGAATNPGEIENTAARFRPTIMDTTESAKNKMNRLREFMSMTLDQLKESGHISQATHDKAKGTNLARPPLSSFQK